MIGRFDITLANFPCEFAGCFMIAAEKGHKDIIDFFLSLNALKIIALKHLVHGLNSGLEKTSVSESHKEIVDAVISSIKSDKESGILPEYRLSQVFKAALANDCIKVVEAITKSIDPSFLYNALKSSVEKKHRTEDSSVSEYYENLIGIIIKSLTPELLYKVLASAHNEKIVTIIVNSISVECLCQILHLFLEQGRAETIKNVINSEHILHSDSYGKAFVQAVKNSQINVVQLFINSSRFKFLASDYLNQSLAVPNERINQMIRNSDKIKNLNVTEF